MSKTAIEPDLTQYNALPTLKGPAEVHKFITETLGAPLTYTTIFSAIYRKTYKGPALRGKKISNALFFSEREIVDWLNSHDRDC